MRRADKNWAKFKAQQVCDALEEGEPIPTFKVRTFNHLGQRKIKFKDKIKELDKRYKLK